MKPSQKDPSGEQPFQKTFLVDSGRKAVLAGRSVRKIMHTSGIKEGCPATEIPLLLESTTGKEVKTAASRRYLVREVKEVRLVPENVRGHSWRIDAAIEYDNSPSGVATTAGFLGLLAYGAKWSYMHAYH